MSARKKAITTTLTIAVSKELKDKLKNYAKSKGVPCSLLLNKLVSDFVRDKGL